MNLPEAYKQRMAEILEAEYENYVASLDSPRYYGVRANTLKISPEELNRLFGGEWEKVSWCESGFYYGYNGSNRLSKSPYYNAGLYYLQEPSAMSAAEVLDVRPGERVLDICASPGGKTAQLAGAMKNRGVLVSNDYTTKRIPQLLKNIELIGIKNCVVTNESPARLASAFPCYFDKILVDAPCSGEGMFRKDEDAVLAWDENKSQRLNEIQRDILYNAAKMLKNGGRLVYSTCTFSPMENERMIAGFLNSQGGEFEIVPIDHKKFGFSPGRGDLAEDARLNGSARIWPHVQKGEGHFIALMERVSGGEATERIPEKARKEKEPLEFTKFRQENIKNMPEGEIQNHSGFLQLPPAGLPDLSGLRIIRAGLLLGRLKNGRFEPSGAMGLALTKEDFARSVDFPVYSQEMERYLRGEAFDISGGEGYNLFCAGGYPLGIIKIHNGRLKGRATL